MFGHNKRHGLRGNHGHGHPMFGGGFGRGFGGRHGWGEGGSREGGRSRRMFDGGELRLVLLKLIADEPRHGYDLIRQIEELTGGAYAPSPGVVYPTITLLDDMDLVEGKQEGAKKLFAVTEAGTAHLAENAEAVAALFARLAAVGEERARTDHRSIKRAMMNLGIALKDRLSDRDLDDETLQAVVALLDEAAQKIERL
ncbi:PadR family transcriptional regulator [Sphingomonas immobilis]|uniref:PadR family transcriptional regulator n=1 Tax=Sphingomonas immobilis TaxID=3063997 RepID=A0ABT8ZZF0_9SPHN|nr:PadR family transcriptional regulator [Sphingomonas sp. CA1-15]MDO7842955.1 PadR family transcriptional regulator [Sphingomonas sp. CA1-15]